MSLGNIFAVIPARGGSKGIPNKNIIDVSGRPLIDYSIKAALESNVDEVWVSTDSPDIESVALDSGANVLIRPDDISGDYSNSEEALVHFAKCVPDFDTLVFIQCTSPLTLSCDIDGGLSLYDSSDVDSVISGCVDSGGYFCGGFQWLELDYAERVTPYEHQRQNSPTYYRENGAFYINSRANILEHKSRLHGNIKFYEMPKSRSFEIDSYEDLESLINLIG